MDPYKYPEFKQLNLPAIDRQMLEKWAEENTFEESISLREGKAAYTFYEGPPSANGMPGIHHVMARTIKDIFCRYKTLQGFQVKRKGGWDTHGLPVELSVEKTLGITKEDIGKKISVADYNAECRKEVMIYKNAWDDLTRKMGYWVDLENPYITFKNEYIESCWWLLQQFYNKSLLYKGYSIQPYSPAAGTGLSSHELNQPGCYRMIKNTTVVAQFKAIINPETASERMLPELNSALYFLAWTTTPWTLPANCALAVGEKIMYVLVETFNPYTFKPVTVILAKDLVTKFFPEPLDADGHQLQLENYKPGNKYIPHKIIGEITGKQLVGIKYEQLMPYVQPQGKAFEVIAADFVSTEEGTGIVHTASVFGSDDFRVCNENNIVSIMVKDDAGNPSPIVDKRGRFVKEITDFSGEFVKEEYLTDAEKEVEKNKQGGNKYLTADERIAIKLKKENKAFKVERYEHSYPHCWRTDKPILYYPLDSWFIKTTAYKERLVELNKTINWKPRSTGIGRFENWLENLVDWNLSRSRFWGIPLPIWTSEDRSEQICIGSVEELHHEINKSIKARLMKKNPVPAPGASDNNEFDLHRPYVDEIVLVSAKGKKMLREPDLIDVWFDSGAMPYAQHHWPFTPLTPKGGIAARTNEDAGSPQEIGSEHSPFGGQGAFPADFIAEGVDQTRGWFFTLHAIAVMLFDSVAFKNVICNGLVLDKSGNKMSKRLGNAADPFETIKNYGADATRWYMIGNAQPWDNLKFNSEGIAEVQRKFFGTVFNTYSFFALYGNIDGFRIDEKNIVPVEKRPELDRWIISRLHTLITEVTGFYDDYEPTKAVRAIEVFADEHLSNWYVRLSRRRFWKSQMSEDKKAAYETLYECLMVMAQLMSPVAPFFSDWLYRNLSDGIREQARDNNTPLKYASVHHSLMTVPENNVIDKNLEERMHLAQKICSMVLSLRKKVSIRVRQPLSRIIIPMQQKGVVEKIMSVQDLICSETNVKKIEFMEGTSDLVKKRIRPDYKILGKKAGPKMKLIAEAIAGLSDTEIAQFEKEDMMELQLGEDTFSITKEDVDIVAEEIPGRLIATENDFTVALDTSITEELYDEGIARDLVSRLQNIRKEKGLNVTDKVLIKIKAHEAINKAVSNNFSYICTELLAASLKVVNVIDDQDGTLIEVNDKIQIFTSIKKAN